MSSLKHQAPRPASSRVSPAYPRILAIGAMLLAGCGGMVENRASGDAGTKPTPETETVEPPGPSGAAPYPFDTGIDPAPVDTGTDTGTPDTGIADTGTVETGADTGMPTPDPAGDMPLPYEDAGVAEGGSVPPTPAP